MADNDFQELGKLAKCWIGHNSYDPCCEEIARDGAINDCGDELLELLTSLKKKRAKNLNAIAKMAFDGYLANIAGKSGLNK